MDQTIIFDKSYEQRLQDYLNIFNVHEISSASEVSHAWSSYLESIIDPFGWQAIWKIPYYDCADFKIPYPTLALVFVDGIQFDALAADVKIVSVEFEDFPIERYEVNLNHLWPTEDQDSTLCMDINQLCETLDKFRFFYKHLWRPWDAQDDLQSDWVKRNLESRLRLYYDLKTGVIPKNMAFYYRSQLIEAKEKFLRMENLQTEINDEECELEASEDTENKEKIDFLYMIHADLTKLKSKLALFENPILRLKRLQLDKDKNEKHYEKPIAWLIFDTDKQWDDYMKFMEHVRNYYSTLDLTCNTANSLQQAFEDAAPGDIIYICAGTHVVNGTGNFITGGGTVINVDYPREAIIESRKEHALFEIGNGTSLVLENIHIKLNNARYGVKLKPGCNLRMKNCIFSENSDLSERLSIQRAIHADGGKIDLTNCKIENSVIGISAVGTTANLILENCTFVNCDTAVFTHNIENISIHKCEFLESLKCGINFIFDTNDNEAVKLKESTGDVTILSEMPNIEIKKTKFDLPVGIPEVIISKKLKFRPMLDVLSNPAFNSTMKK